MTEIELSDYCNGEHDIEYDGLLSLLLGLRSGITIRDWSQAFCILKSTICFKWVIYKFIAAYVKTSTAIKHQASSILLSSYFAEGGYVRFFALGMLEVVPGHSVNVMSLLPHVKSTLLAGVPPAAPGMLVAVREIGKRQGECRRVKCIPSLSGNA